MRTLREMKAFRRDLKQVKKSGTNYIDDIERVVALLLNDKSLPKHVQDHALSGAWKTVQARECHIKPDLLLIYAKPPGELQLLRLGSHAELFG